MMILLFYLWCGIIGSNWWIEIKRITRIKDFSFVEKLKTSHKNKNI